jgi:GNAT superfamily N-acetyltransferase
VHATEVAEAAAHREFGTASPGRTRVADVAGSVCVAIPELDSPMVNHVVGLPASAGDEDLDAIAAFYGDIRHAVAVHPDEAALEPRLRERGYEPGYAWMKFGRGVEPPPERPTELRVAAAGPEDADAFGRVVAEGYGMPEACAGLIASVVGRAGYHCFLAWDGERPTGAGALHAVEQSGWCGVAATLPEARGRGAQNALFAARIRRAAELGCTAVYTETGEQVDGRPAASYRNILRNGFRELYLRPNWLSPG